MKLSEVTPENESNKGTYAAVRFDKRTVNALEKFNTTNKVPNVNKDWHTTLLYSRKHLPNYEAEKKYSTPFIGTPTGFEVWPSDKKKNVLVLTFSCPNLYQRHHKLMQQHGGTYDFDVYKPHVTLSYDAGDIDINELPEFKKQLKLIGEFTEDLDDA